MTNILQSPNLQPLCIEDCRGDFEEISRLMESSWAGNANQSLFFSADYLASCFEYPGASLSLAPTIYEGAKPVAFAAGIPRRISLNGCELNVVIITFLTAANDYKKRGYGIVIWNELVKRARTAGFDGMVNYGTDGESMNDMIPKCCRMLGLPATHIRTIPYWSRMIRPKNAGSSGPEPNESAVERFLELAQPMKQVPLARTWTFEEAEWQCKRRFGSLTVELESGLRRGMVVGYVMPVANAARTKCAIVEDVFWGDLEAQERGILVKTFLDRAALAGAQLAVIPVLGYADLEPFHAARFRPSQRVQHAYLTVWKGDPAAEDLPSMYLDII